MSGKTGKDRKLKKKSDAFRKTPVHSYSGRHHDDRWRNASDVFRSAYIYFYYYFRSLPSTYGNCRSEYRHRTKCFKVHYTPFTLKRTQNRFIIAWYYMSTECHTALNRMRRRVNRRLIRIQAVCIWHFGCSY